MSAKVISLAERRRKRLGLVSGGGFGRPVNRERYDAWLEADGSLVLRFEASTVDMSRGGSFVDQHGNAAFTLRDNGAEVRIPSERAEEWFKDMFSFQIGARHVRERRSGMHEWRSEPAENGCYVVSHMYHKAAFEPFSPRPRSRWVGTGELEDNGWGGKFEKREKRKVAPLCESCRRVIPIGETAFREKRGAGGRVFGDVVLCVGCVKPKAIVPNNSRE